MMIVFPRRNPWCRERVPESSVAQQGAKETPTAWRRKNTETAEALKLPIRGEKREGGDSVDGKERARARKL